MSKLKKKVESLEFALGKYKSDPKAANLVFSEASNVLEALQGDAKESKHEDYGKVFKTLSVTMSKLCSLGEVCILSLE